MPGLNGFQATRQLTKDSETSHIQVIIITTKDQETDKVWGTRQGARDYLTKPVEEGHPDQDPEQRPRPADGPRHEPVADRLPAAAGNRPAPVACWRPTCRRSRPARTPGAESAFASASTGTWRRWVKSAKSCMSRVIPCCGGETLGQGRGQPARAAVADHGSVRVFRP